MGTKKKKSQKNAAFKKVKLKVGKTLKKTNTTDTTIEARKVVLLSQLEEQKNASSTAVYSYRGLSLENLCTQLGHYSKAVRRNAIVGAKQILSSAPHLIEHHLRTIVPAFARLISITDTDAQTYAQLRSLLELVCTVPTQVMAAHFPLFVAHVLRGLTHSHENVRSFAVTVLRILLERYPEMCRESGDIFQTLVHFIGSGKKTTQSTRVYLEFIASFLRIYDETRVVERKCVEVRLTTVSKEGSEGGRVAAAVEMVLSGTIDLHPDNDNMDPFYMPLSTCSTSGAGSSSLFAAPDALLSLTQALSTLMGRVVLDDDRNLSDIVNRILGLMRRALERQPNKFMMLDFEERYRKATEPLRKAVTVRRDNKKLAEAAKWLLQGEETKGDAERGGRERAKGKEKGKDGLKGLVEVVIE